MIQESGVVGSLKELGEKFLEFAQKSGADAQAWELIDNRLSSFYGATLKVKIPNKTVDGKDPYFYISLQHTNVTSTTYREFIRNTPYNYNSELYDRNDTVFDSSGRPLYSKSFFGSNGGENPFKNTGEFIALGLHTLYDENLWMCEQGQVTCEGESKAQNNQSGILGNLWRRNGAVGANTVVSFPGTGCPWLTISDQNKEDYITALHKIDYWFTKGDTDATITFRIAGIGNKPARWQSISFGRMKAIDDDSYLFPLFVAGGTGALSQAIEIYSNNAGYPTYSAGNYYDLSMDNICMSNCNLLYPTKFNGSQVSNFRVLAPDGLWRDIFGFSQVATVKAMPICYGYVSNWGYPLSRPTTYSDGHSAIVFSCPSENRIDTYTVKESFNKNKSSTPVNEVIVVINKNISDYFSAVAGVIPNSYYTWSRSLPSGVIELNGKQYLSVPNGWEQRLFYYASYFGQVDYWDNDTLRNDFEALINGLNNNMFTHNLLIPFDGDEV